MSDAFEVIHSSASALYRIGAIDKATMREFDLSCLAAPPRKVAQAEMIPPLASKYIENDCGPERIDDDCSAAVKQRRDSV